MRRGTRRLRGLRDRIATRSRRRGPRRPGRRTADRLAVVRCRDHRPCLAVVEAIGDPIGTGPFVDRTEDRARFEGAEHRDESLEDTRHVREQSIAELNPELVEDVDELVRPLGEFPERDAFTLVLGSDVVQRDLALIDRVRITDLVGDVDLVGRGPVGRRSRCSPTRTPLTVLRSPAGCDLCSYEGLERVSTR